MEPAAILDELMRSEGLPREALRAAAERRADMVPLFVQQIERYIQAGSIRHATDAPLFFVFHLLGDWRETSAYRVLARLLSCPSNHLDALIADGNTENSHRVMAAVFDGDPAPLYNIILDENADEYARSRMCDALAMLVVQGRLDRSEAASFLRDCWIEPAAARRLLRLARLAERDRPSRARRTEGHRQGGLRPADRQSQLAQLSGLRGRPRARDREPD